jgi:DNA-binding winged helix-turn-helix (wHTH) protein
MRYAFGRFVLDLGLCQLRRDDAPVPMQPKVMDALAYLVERRERVVAKEELMVALWPGEVTESVLPRCISAARKALDDDDEGIIKTVRGRGYRFVAEVVARGSSAAAPPGAALTTPSGRVFVGREALLKTLEATLDHALDGRGRALVLAGERGLGKSRTAARLLRSAMKRGAHALMLSCAAGRGAPVRWPFVQLVRRARGQEAEAAPRLEAMLVRDDGDAFAVHDAVTTFVHRFARERGLLVVLDDLHLADGPTLALVEHLAAQLHDARLMLLVTLRERGIVAGDPLGATLSRLAREAASCQRLELGPLDAREVRAFVAHHRRADPGGALVEAIVAESGGNPFFIDARVAELAAARWTEEGLERCPAAVRAAVGVEREGLSVAARAALDVAAVLDDAPLGLVARTADLAPAECLAALDAAARAGLVAAPLPERPAFSFTPPLVRRAIYDDLEPAARRAIHRRVAEALSGSSEDELALRAHHLTRTGHDADRAHARRDAAEAGALALARGDASAAERHHRAALELSEGQRGFEAAALLGVARARAALGADARELLRRAAAAAHGEGALLYQVALTRAAPFEPAPHADPELVELLDAARAAAPDRDGAVHLAALAAGISPGFEARAALSLPLDVAHEARAAVLRARYAAAPEEGHTVADGLASIGRADDAHFVRYGAALADDDLPGARRELLLFGERPGAFHAWRHRWLTASMALAEGRVASLDGEGHPFAPVLALAYAAWGALERGAWADVPAAAAALARACPHLEGLGRALVALAHVENGEIEPPRRALAQQDVGRGELFVTALWGRVAAAVGDRHAASRHLDALEPHAGRAVVEPLLRIHAGSVAGVLGELAAATGDRPRAEAYLHDALARAERNLCPGPAARARAALAR